MIPWGIAELQVLLAKQIGLEMVARLHNQGRTAYIGVSFLGH